MDWEYWVQSFMDRGYERSDAEWLATDLINDRSDDDEDDE